MNKLITLVLILCLSCQLVLKLSIIAWFEINQEYITATLCENKNKPELVCCGKCVLTKQLKKADDSERQDKKNTPTKAEQTATVVFILPDHSTHSIPFLISALPIQNGIVPNHFEAGVALSIFHPPGVRYC